MATFATNIARRAARWVYLVQIEGIGDVDGLHTWSTGAPSYAAADARFSRRDTIAALPKITHGRTASILGGMPEAGSATVELVDYADLITAAMRDDVPPNSVLASNLSASATSISLVDGSALPSGSFVWWCGAEAILIASRSSNTLTVATGGRAWLGTAARSHAAGDNGYTTPPFVRTRLLSIYLAPYDAANDTEALSYPVGTYRIDRIGIGRGLGVWRLGGLSEERSLSRLVGGRPPFALRVQSVSGTQQILWSPVPSSVGAADYAQIATTLGGWPDGATFLQVERTGEIVRGRANTSNRAPYVMERGVGGTKIDTIEGGDIIRPVLVMDDVYGSTRWSPGPTPSTNRSTGTWNVSAHAVDQLLCGLTSAAHSDDGLELLNYDATYGNWSSWPPGFGIGYRADRIDLASFLAVKARHPAFELPDVVIGAGERPTFGEWATTNMLEPFGWFLVVIGQLLTLVAPRLLLEGETPDDTLGPEDILEVGEVDRAMDVVAGAVTYKLRGEGDKAAPITVRASDYTALFGGRAQYTVEDDPLELELPGLRASRVGASALVARMAQRVLMRAVRAPWRVPLVIDGAHHTIAEGSVISITHPDLPNSNTGTRGWSSMLAQVTSASRVRLDKTRGLVRDVVVLAYPGMRVGRIAPSAIISSVTGTGPWVCTVAANRYTAADAAAVLELPDTDAEAFATTDVLKTIQRNGLDRTTGYTVTATGANTVTVSGSTAPLAGDVLVFADYAAATANQRTRFAQWADDRGEVAAGVPAWRFGES